MESMTRIAVRCRRGASTALRKNGRTPGGQQKFHGTDGNLYGTLAPKEAE